MIILKLSAAQKESAIGIKDNFIKQNRKDKEPYLTNLNEDPLLSYIICYFLTEPVTLIGTSSKAAVQLRGLGILEEHATVKNNNNIVELSMSNQDAKILVNGVYLKGSKILEDQDRIVFGTFSKSNPFVMVQSLIMRIQYLKGRQTCSYS
jgi:hypothetical protein